jgi:hypothetical protein
MSLPVLIQPNAMQYFGLFVQQVTDLWTGYIVGHAEQLMVR